MKNKISIRCECCDDIFERDADVDPLSTDIDNRVMTLSYDDDRLYICNKCEHLRSEIYDDSERVDLEYKITLTKSDKKMNDEFMRCMNGYFNNFFKAKLHIHDFNIELISEA